MRVNNFKYRITLLLMIFAMGLTSCVYDNLEEPNDSNPYWDTEGFSLGITITLDRDLQSRADEDSYDNYIDTENKLRVLFFDQATGNFIFEAVDRTVMPRKSSNDKEEWFIHIPVNYIVDYDGAPYDTELLKNRLKTNAFKVAILANWPVNGETNVNGNLTYGGEPRWGVNESVFGSNTKNINDLHHLEVDTNYFDNSRENRPTQTDVYDFIMGDNGEMGVKTDWVRSRMIDSKLDPKALTSTEVAKQWIRDNWDPTPKRNASKDIYRHYQDLWALWDFDAAYRYNSTGGKSYNNNWGKEWYDKNGSTLNTWLRNTTWTYLRDFVDTQDNAQLTFTQPGYLYTGTSNTGVQINNGTTGKFTFKAHSSGTLTIKARSTSGSATITITRANDEESASTKKLTYNTTIQEQSWDINMTGKTQDVTIECTSGQVVIYSIEYIQAKYLYDSDREGILPSATNPIPMYGVQDYAALTNWQPGTTFDLSYERPENGNYTEKTISLIRSLAKVEFYLPTSLDNKGKINHVYMRSMNRVARCEPMDVVTPTNELWHDVHDNNCEWYNIQSYGPSYVEGTEPQDKSQLDAYTNWLSWFYGSWQTNNTKWNFTTHNKQYGSNNRVTVPSRPAYPHLFNSAIERSDYTHFIYAGEATHNGNICHKYILYVPDRNIDDPNYPGIQSSIAKVPHIEYRFTDQNEVSLDDNECYRVYFTDYKDNSAIKSVKANDYEPTYEKSRTNLAKHWPIMRNHVYRFYVSATTRSGEDGFGVTSQVTTWSGEDLTHAEAHSNLSE